MITKNIFDSWGTCIETQYDELMSQDDLFLTNLVLNRNLLLIKNISNNLTDDQFFNLGKKFGRVWDNNDYKKWYVSKGQDLTINTKSENPVSYFTSTNTPPFDKNYMVYHADMVHVKELSFPGRLLYMVENTTDCSGITSWLNLEYGWEQCSELEKSLYKDLEVVYHDFYISNFRQEKFDFIKKNPKTGKTSPSVNCWYDGHNPGWIHHLEKNGCPLNYNETAEIIKNVYKLLESKKDTLYDHIWEEGDIIVYDNWFSVHKRTAVNDESSPTGKRLLKRLTFNFI